MNQYILKVGNLHDDYLNIADDKKVFKGNYKAILVYYTFANSWCNKENVIRFKTEKTLNAYLSKNYPEFNYYN